MSEIEHYELVESERGALRRYANGTEDWAIGVLIASAVWNVERLEAQLAEAASLLREAQRSMTWHESVPISRRERWAADVDALDKEGTV